MQTHKQQVEKKGRKMLAVLLAVGFISQLSAPVFAQGADFSNLAQGASYPQDSFLPPEVVPQADAGAGQMTMGATQGQLTELSQDAHMNLNQQTGTMSAKGMRQAAFDSLLGNTQMANQMAQYPPQAASNSGQFAPFMQPGQLPAMPGQYAVGQPDWLSPGVATDNSIPQYGNASQTQTLTAGSKVPIVRRDIRKGGYANNISGFAGLGAGLLATQLRRPNSLFGLGFTGLTMTGLGVRNGFRF